MIIYFVSENKPKIVKKNDYSKKRQNIIDYSRKRQGIRLWDNVM